MRFDTSRVGRMALRQKILALASPERDIEDRYEAAAAEVFDRHRDAVEQATRAFLTASEARQQAIAAREAELARLRAERDKALAALGEIAWPEDTLHDEDGALVLCAATGLPILEGDAVLEDQDSGDQFLAAALLPERYADEEETSDAEAGP